MRMELMCNPWSGLMRSGDTDMSSSGRAAAPVPEPMPVDATWHGLPVTGVALEWSGTVTGNPKPVGLTAAQYDCLMTLRYRFAIVVVPPAAAHDRPVNAVFGYTHRTVHGLLRHGLIRQLPGGQFGITDNGLHAVRMHRKARR